MGKGVWEEDKRGEGGHLFPVMCTPNGSAILGHHLQLSNVVWKKKMHAVFLNRVLF